MKNKMLVLALLAVVIVVLAACGGGGGTASGDGEIALVGNAATGEQLFNQATIGPNNSPGCVTCHSLVEGVVVVGPSQAGLAARAAQRVPGETAEAYLRNSIINPNAHVVEGFVEGVMYQNYGEELTEEQLDDLVAYLLTLN